MNILEGRTNMRKITIAVLLNCIVFFCLILSKLYTTIFIYFQYNYAFILEKIPLIIISALIAFIGNKNLKEKIWDFIKIFVFSYLCIWIIAMILFVNTMSKFD